MDTTTGTNGAPATGARDPLAGGPITAENVARLKLQEQLAEAGGFSLDAPLYTLGTGVNSVGVENAKRSRAEWEALPLAAQAFAPFLARIAAEARKDVTVPVRELRLLSSGELTRDGGPGSKLLLGGTMPLRGLMERAGCPNPGAAATYLASIPPARRAAEFNEWTTRADEGKQLVLRTRRALAHADDGQLSGYARELYAVVSTKYGRGLEVDTLARALGDALAQGLFPGDARASIMYDGRRVEIQALWHSDIAPESYCAGEVFKAGVSLGGADDGTFSLFVDALLWRNLCLNLIILQEARKRAATRRHVGEAADLLAWLVDALRTASASVAGFAALWDKARRASLVSCTRDVPADANDAQLVAGVFRGLLKTGRVSLPGYAGEAGVRVLEASFRHEPELSRAGVVNAVTRAAHETAFANVWQAGEIETAAGAILRSAKPFDFVDFGDAF